jgi:hypothetical protein
MRPGELVLSLSVGGLDPRAGDGSVSFRSVRLTPVPVNTFEVTRTAWANAVAADLSRTPDGPSAVSWERTAPGAYRVRLRGVRDHTLVQLAESYTPDWQVSGLPEGWSATHFRADGFANAWKIKGDGDAVVELTYAPGRCLPAAITVSYVFLGLAVWSLVTRRFRRRGAGSLPDLRVLEGFPRRRDTDRDPVTVGTERGLV